VRQPHAGSDARGRAAQSKQPCVILLDDHDLCVMLIDAEFVQRDSVASCTSYKRLDPFHAYRGFRGRLPCLLAAENPPLCLLDGRLLSTFGFGRPPLSRSLRHHALPFVDVPEVPEIPLPSAGGLFVSQPAVVANTAARAACSIFAFASITLGRISHGRFNFASEAWI